LKKKTKTGGTVRAYLGEGGVGEGATGRENGETALRKFNNPGRITLRSKSWMGVAGEGRDLRNLCSKNPCGG